MLAIPAVAPVIVKSLSFVELRVSAKNGVCEASGLAFTSIVTPCGGIVELIVTRNGKFGPGAGASVLPLAGVVVSDKVDSALHGSFDVFFLQYGVERNTKSMATR